MAIVKMDKFNLLSFKENRQELLDRLQDFNYVHLKKVELTEDENYLKEVKNTERLSDIESLAYRVDFVKETVKKLQTKEESKDPDLINLSLEEVNRKAQNFDLDFVYTTTKDLSDKRDGLLQEKGELRTRIKDLSPWKDLDLPIEDLYSFERVNVSIGTLSSNYYEGLKENFALSDFKEAFLEEVSSTRELVYLLAASSLEEEEKFEEFLRDNAVSKVKINGEGKISENISSMEEKVREIDQEVAEIEGKIKAMAKFIPDLNIYDAYLKNLKRKEESSEFFAKSKYLDLVEGYVPENLKDDFVGEMDDLLGDRYAIEIGEADRDDPDVPIILDNKNLVKPYESVVETYSLPRYNEIDPTPLIAPFYTIYTGFMLGDAGYGILLALACLFLLKNKNLSREMEKNVKLFFLTGLSAIVFGLIFGSIFGGAVPIKGLIDTTKDFDAMMLMSIIIGGIALFFSLGVKGYMEIRDGKPLDAVYDVLFRYMAVGGAIALYLTKSSLSKTIMIVGMVGIVLTGGRQSPSIGGKIAEGLYSLYGISSWIGDFVSFLRLMALVLSGGFIGYAVNLICEMLLGSGIGGIIGAVIVFVVFHLFNMFLSTLSCYVHSLRLVYVEMFNKFYEGGGKKFRKMVEDSKFIKIIGGKNE